MANFPQGGNGHNEAERAGSTAGGAASGTVPGSQHGSEAMAAAKEKAALARDQLTVGVADAFDTSKEAARQAKIVLDEKLEGLMDSGKDVLGQAEELIRSRPWASFGVAFAAGYLIAKMTRSSKD